MSGKPQKRLVSRGLYLRLLGKRTVLSSSASGIGCMGVLLLLVSGFSLVRFAVFHQVLNQSIYGFCFAVIGSAGAGTMALRIARNLLKEAKAIERVAPVTRHNTGLLSEVETLVRAFDPPRTHQQSELLRAAEQGPDLTFRLRADVAERPGITE